MSNIVEEIEDYVRQSLDEMTLEEFLEEHGMDPVEAALILWADGHLDFWELDPFEDIDEGLIDEQ